MNQHTTHSHEAHRPDGMRQLILAAGFTGCLVAGLSLDSWWISRALLAAAVLVGVAIVIELFTITLSALVAWQRRRYSTMDDTGQTLVVPNAQIQGEDVKRLLTHPDINDKSRGALRKLIRWWHAPCSDCHQEIMDHNAFYDALRPVTARILAKPVDEARQIARRHLDVALQQQHAQPEPYATMKLRRLIGPIAAGFSYEYALGRPCPPDVLPLMMASMANVLTATGAMTGRDMALRTRALDHVREHVRAESGRIDLFGEDCELSIDQRAQYLMGVWIHTATAQILRLTCNAVSYLARHPRCLAIVRQQAATGGTYMDAVLLEVLRLAPGVPNTDRFVAQDVTLKPGLDLKRGTNVVITVGDYQRTGFERPDDFIPERWENLDRKQANFIAFSVGKRRCPAERLSLAVAKELTVGLLTSLDVHLPAGVGVLFTARPNIANDLCCVVRRPPTNVMPLAAVRWGLGAWLAIDNLRKSFVQLATMPRNARDAFRE